MKILYNLFTLQFKALSMHRVGALPINVKWNFNLMYRYMLTTNFNNCSQLMTKHANSLSIVKQCCFLSGPLVCHLRDRDQVAQCNSSQWLRKATFNINHWINKLRKDYIYIWGSSKKFLMYSVCFWTDGDFGYLY